MDLDSKDEVRERVNAKVEERNRAYGIPCSCACGCRVKHRFGQVCVLCRDGRCWTEIADMLDQIMTRAEA